MSNLNPDQFTPRIQSSRNAYGTTSVYTEEHDVTDHNGRVLRLHEYHWHDGDSPAYIEARGRLVKKDGQPANRGASMFRQPPAHVLTEMKRLRGE